ncbi:uncharacterized protein LOC131018818 [Salvia miltiorrhiza]|uniref:uncharacterized protein LOC131018818 n=1 Tax=Salvia miltiorrhiza TaxID=226208 RepID=UPI0025ACF201|nr:uncharacterized protein LOC131018818 [Salvia miltiorrhiza]
MAISSPGRQEKFQPPSKKLSRSSTGSRSRQTPIFYRRKGGGGMTESGDEEPYSPKVTCIGQVRPRKSGGRRRRCWFWGRILWRRRGLRRVLYKWAVFLKCKKVDAVAEDCLRKLEAPPRNGLMMSRIPQETFQNVGALIVHPLMLTRCKSEPARISYTQVSFKYIHTDTV